MRAAVLATIPSELEVTDIQVDKPGPREVLVRTVAAGVCHSDLHFMEGKYPYATPTIPGHEAAGVVEAVGARRHRRPAGRPRHRLPLHLLRPLRVLPLRPPRPLQTPGAGAARSEPPPPFRATASRSTSSCASPPSPSRCWSTRTPWSRFATDMPLDRAALIGCARHHRRRARSSTPPKSPPGSTVAVIGCGGVGLNSVQGAAIAGAGRVIAIDTMPWKLDLASEFGATDAGRRHARRPGRAGARS